MSDVTKLLEGATPPHTRLILASEDLFDNWGTLTEDGRRITVDWGEQRPEGWYEPEFTAHEPPRIRDYEAAVDALDRLTDAASVEEEDWSPQTHDELVAALNEAGAILRRLREAVPA